MNPINVDRVLFTVINAITNLKLDREVLIIISLKSFGQLFPLSAKSVQLATELSKSKLFASQRA